MSTPLARPDIPTGPPAITPTGPPARRHRRSVVVVIAGALLGAVGVAGPADALLRPADTDAGVIDRLRDRRPDRPIDTAPSDVRPTDRVPEHLRLACAVRQTDERPAVTCTWSVPTADGAVAVRLVRATVGSSQGRTVIHRSSELEANEFVDTEVRPGNRYRYAVQALDVHHRIVGASASVTIGVPPIDAPPPGVEVLKLACHAAAVDSPDDRVHVGCEWSLPQRDGSRVLTLWRSVDGSAREEVASSTRPFRSSYRDVVPAGTRTVVYAVIATDGAGTVVARSRAAHVRIRPTVTPTVAPTRIPPAPAPPVDPVPAVDQVPLIDEVAPVDSAPVARPMATDQVERDSVPTDDVRPDPARPRDRRPDAAPVDVEQPARATPDRRADERRSEPAD